MDDKAKSARFGFASGILFGIAWWFFIDAVVSSAGGKNLPIIFGFWMPGIGATLAFLMYMLFFE